MNNKLRMIPPATTYAAKIRHSSLTVARLVAQLCKRKGVVYSRRLFTQQ